MKQTQREEQDWHYECKAMWAEPHPEVRETIMGLVFTRTLGKRCPYCGDIFFTYQVEGHEREPYRVDPDSGARETCGHPKCWDAEEDRFVKQQIEWHRTHFRLEGNPVPEPRGGGKLVPFKGRIPRD